MESMDIMPFATVLTISLGRQHAAYKALSLQKKKLYGYFQSSLDQRELNLGLIDISKIYFF